MAADPARPPLSPEQYDRYRRHLILPEIGLEGQRALLDARVLLIGAGGLGCPTAQYLAAAGVGTLGLVDFDRVDTTNLHRQILYGTADVGRLKVDVAAERIAAMNPDVLVERHALRLSSENALELFAEYDVIVDGADNFPTRYLTNDACVLLGRPNVHGSIFRFDGQATVFDARHGPCYRCLYPEPPPPGAVPSCAEGGVLGVLPGLVALIQATETVKIVTGVGEPLYGRLLQYEALRMEFHEFRVKKDAACPLCGTSPTIKELIDYEGFCGMPSEAPRAPFGEVSAHALSTRRAAGEDLLLLDVREPAEWETARIAGAQLIPLASLPSRIEELAAWRARPVVVHCHHGGRSAKACAQLASAGFTRVENLAGGIDAWSLTVDPARSALLRDYVAKAKIPGPLERRHLVEKQLPPAQARAIADAYLAEDRMIEAIDFLKIAGAEDGLAELRARAVAEGDVFLLRAVAAAQVRPPTRDDWQKLAAAAAANGKERYAVEARRQAERSDD